MKVGAAGVVFGRVRRGFPRYNHFQCKRDATPLATLEVGNPIYVRYLRWQQILVRLLPPPNKPS